MIDLFVQLSRLLGHPCKIYNLLAIAAPILYIGPRPSHVTEILERLPKDYPWWHANHGDVEAVRSAFREAQVGPQVGSDLRADLSPTDNPEKVGPDRRAGRSPIVDKVGPDLRAGLPTASPSHSLTGSQSSLPSTDSQPNRLTVSQSPLTPLTLLTREFSQGALLPKLLAAVTGDGEAVKR